MAQVLGPSGVGPRTDHVVIATPAFSDAAIVAANRSAINGTVVQDVVARQPADFAEFAPLTAGLTVQFTQPATAARWDMAFALANASATAEWEVRAGDSTNEAVGTEAYDSSGGGKHGTIAGGPTFEQGTYGGALRLTDAATQYVETPALATGVNVTVMGWVTPDAPDTDRFLFEFGMLTGNWVATYRADGRLQVGPGPACVTPDPLVAMYPTHVAVAFVSADTCRIYLDGVLVAEVFGEVVTPVPSTDVMRWGHAISPSGSDAPFLGALDDLRIYSRVLTAAEIQAAMASETPDDATGLLVQYKLNGYHSGVRTFGMPPNLPSRTRRGAFLLAPYAMTNTVVRVTITDPDNLAPFRVHRIAIGPGWQPERNFDFGEGVGFDDDSRATRTPTSQTMVVRRVPVPVLEFVVRHLSRRDMLANAYEIARAQGTSGEVVVCLNPNDEEFQEAVTLYGRLAEIGRLTEPHHGLWETTYRVEGFL